MIKKRLRRLETLLNYMDRNDPADAPAPKQLQTVQDVIDVLQEQVEALRAEPWVDTVDRARAIGYLAGIALRAIEAGNTAARLEALEAVLKQRNGETNR